MGALGDLVGGLLKPLLVALLILVALSLFSSRPDAGGGTGFACTGFTDDPALNRMICRFHPARIWNMPVADLLPWFGAAE